MRKHARDLVFYAEDHSQWTYYEGLVNHLTQVKAQPICYITSEYNDPILLKNNPLLSILYINKLLWLFTITLNSKVLLMTMPEIELYHVKRSLRGTHHVYLYHNIGAAFTTLRHRALYFYDSVLLSGPHHQEEIQKEEIYYKLKPKQLIPFGYYRLEKIYHEFKQYRQGKIQSNINRVLFAPSWGPQSALNLAGITIIEQVLKAGFQLTLRPHQMSKRFDASLLATINQHFANNINYTYDDNGASIHSLFESDILISDWSGIAYEYTLGTERPALLINTPQKILNPNWSKLDITPIDNILRPHLGATLELTQINNVADKLQEIVSNLNEFPSRMQNLRKQHIYNFGHSSEIGADFILKLLH